MKWWAAHKVRTCAPYDVTLVPTTELTARFHREAAVNGPIQPAPSRWFLGRHHLVGLHRRSRAGGTSLDRLSPGGRRRAGTRVATAAKPCKKNQSSFRRVRSRTPRRRQFEYRRSPGHDNIGQEQVDTSRQKGVKARCRGPVLRRPHSSGSSLARPRRAASQEECALEVVSFLREVPLVMLAPYWIASA